MCAREKVCVSERERDTDIQTEKHRESERDERASELSAFVEQHLHHLGSGLSVKGLGCGVQGLRSRVEG